jgi:ectoine hydroxylase-related dioxygenase (phytanoyl-CoA dioxygenase family)
VAEGEEGSLFEEARRVEGGALPRGPERWYVEVQPERISGFVEIVTHDWFVTVCEAVLGPDYRIVEVGFDIPFPGAADQPWHRDFAVPEATIRGRRLNSLAFNLTTVDTRPEHGPFEVALGTQWDQFEGCPKGMFPPQQLWARYAARAVQKLPQRGDISARSALTVHRGTANRSSEPRPVLVVGVDAPDATNAAHHDLQVTRAYFDGLPTRVRDHLTCRIVDRLEPIVQHHVIEGLLAPTY